MFDSRWVATLLGMRPILLVLSLLFVLGCEIHDSRHCHVLLEDRVDDPETEVVEQYVTRLDCPFLEATSE